MSAPVRIDKPMLRNFGLLFGGILIGLFGLLLPWLFGRPLPRWPFYVGAPVALLALVWPLALGPLFRVWMKFGAVMGRINTFIILNLLFFVVLTPIGWLMRLAGKDPLARRFEAERASYRIVRQPESKEHMEKPY
jgi:hypothetical protein